MKLMKESMEINLALKWFGDLLKKSNLKDMQTFGSMIEFKYSKTTKYKDLQ